MAIVLLRKVFRDKKVQHMYCNSTYGLEFFFHNTPRRKELARAAFNWKKKR